MPYRDGTGPLGLGPRTGWGRGYCSGYPVTSRYWAPGATMAHITAFAGVVEGSGK